MVEYSQSTVIVVKRLRLFSAVKGPRVSLRSVSVHTQVICLRNPRCTDGILHTMYRRRVGSLLGSTQKIRFALNFKIAFPVFLQKKKSA